MHQVRRRKIVATTVLTGAAVPTHVPSIRLPDSAEKFIIGVQPRAASRACRSPFATSCPQATDHQRQRARPKCPTPTRAPADAIRVCGQARRCQSPASALAAHTPRLPPPSARRAHRAASPRAHLRKTFLSCEIERLACRKKSSPESMLVCRPAPDAAATSSTATAAHRPHFIAPLCLSQT